MTSSSAKRTRMEAWWSAQDAGPDGEHGGCAVRFRALLPRHRDVATAHGGQRMSGDAVVVGHRQQTLLENVPHGAGKGEADARAATVRILERDCHEVAIGGDARAPEAIAVEDRHGGKERRARVHRVRVEEAWSFLAEQ